MQQSVLDQYDSGEGEYKQVLKKQESLIEEFDLGIEEDDPKPEEIEITFGVTQMSEALEQIMESYGSTEDSVSLVAYGKQDEGYSEKMIEKIEDDEDAGKKEAVFLCQGCDSEFDMPGVCRDCNVVLKEKEE